MAHVLDKLARARATGHTLVACGPVRMAHVLADSSDFGLLGEQSSPKMCDSLPLVPMNCPEKFDANSFIVGRKIRNRTNKQTQTYKQTNKQ